jgi:signal transduction histidine kinase
MDGDGPLPIRCEANISIMEDNVMVIVVRDISERFRRFEVEKNVISETTARRKDAAANRFTRHEVKNGLLAAIGLCDSLADFSMASNTIQNDNPEVKKNNPGLKKEPFNIALASAVHLPNDNSHYVSELGKTLKEILDTVLAEAMARDVIHEVYEPKLEKVDLPLLLAIAANPPPNDARSKRYLIHTNISPLPEFSLDPQLWKYIHRNAVSNACKYGKASGTVTTELHWDELNKILKMDVINLPGKNHEEIMKLGDKASELIFSPRKRLSVHTAVDGNNHVSASHSAGDGAWIMHKCAKTLGGECTIKVRSIC